MYVKEDLIIPHTVSFYDLIVQKARGKSGPLFHFDVHEDVRMQSDATVEKDESHAGAAKCISPAEPGPRGKLCFAGDILGSPCGPA